MKVQGPLEWSSQPPLAATTAFDLAMSLAASEADGGPLLVAAFSPSDLSLVLARLPPATRVAGVPWPAILLVPGWLAGAQALMVGDVAVDSEQLQPARCRAVLWADTSDAVAGADTARLVQRCLASEGMLVVVTTGAAGRSALWPGRHPTSRSRRSRRDGRIPGISLRLEHCTRVGRPAAGAGYALAARLAARAGRPDLADRWEAGCRLAACSSTRGPALFNVLAYRRP